MNKFRPRWFGILSSTRVTTQDEHQSALPSGVPLLRLQQAQLSSLRHRAAANRQYRTVTQLVRSEPHGKCQKLVYVRTQRRRPEGLLQPWPGTTCTRRPGPERPCKWPKSLPSPAWCYPPPSAHLPRSDPGCCVPLVKSMAIRSVHYITSLNYDKNIVVYIKSVWLLKFNVVEKSVM